MNLLERYQPTLSKFDHFQELDIFCVQLGEIQNNLAKVLTYISEFHTEDKPKEKGIGSALKKMGGTLAAFAKSRMNNA